MKTNKLFYWPLMLAVLVSGLVSCYDDSDIVKRLEALETTAITSINEQITAIKASVTSLETVDKEVKSTIQKLEERASSLQGEIDKLKAEDTSLQEEINKLKEEDAILQEEIKKLFETDASLQEEISKLLEEDTALKGEIEKLKAEDTTLKAEIDKLIKEDSSIQGEIAKLKEADESLGKRIDELKTYVESEISNTKDWATTTFATLEQYDSLCVVLVDIKSSISDLRDEFSESLTSSIADSKTSMEEWVNKQLTGYWTIAETQVRLDSLKQTESEDIAKLSEELAKAKTELTDAYTLAISKAIEESEGKLSDEITKINENLEKSINSIEERLTKIEETLSTLTRDFAITFDDTEVGILAGGTTSVGYTITGATEKTTVKALGQNGWSAKVTPNGTDKGTITVTAPNPLTEDEIIVLVYDGEYRTIMSSINFVTGTVTPSQTAVELEAEAGTVDITVTSNLNYKVSIPEDAQDWLSVVETRATKTETVKFEFKECIGGIRKAVVSFVDEANKTISSMTFIQQGSAMEIITNNGGELLSLVGADNITFIKGLIVSGPINGTDIKYIRRMSNLKFLDITNAKIVSGGDSYYRNEYTEKDRISECMFANLELEVVYLPKDVIEIASEAFYCCKQLKKVYLGDKVISLGHGAFTVCESLENIILPNSLKYIGSAAFNLNSKLKEIGMSENLEFIGEEAFSNCYSLVNLIIPPKTNSIGYRAFNGCFALKEVHIKAKPETLLNIGTDLFMYFSSSETNSSIYEKTLLYIPKGSKDYYYNTDFGRFTNIIEE